MDIRTLTRRGGWRINHKNKHRVYREEGLSLSRRFPRQCANPKRRANQISVSKTADCWIKIFVADNLFSGHWLRAQIVIDTFGGECSVIIR
jgi:putative transposase